MTSKLNGGKVHKPYFKWPVDTVVLMQAFLFSNPKERWRTDESYSALGTGVSVVFCNNALRLEHGSQPVVCMVIP